MNVDGFIRGAVRKSSASLIIGKLVGACGGGGQIWVLIIIRSQVKDSIDKSEYQYIISLLSILIYRC